MRIIPIVLVVIIGILSCESESCQDVTDMNIIISETSNSFIDNYRDANTIIFENQSNQEIEFSISEITSTTNSFTFSMTCLESPSERQSISGESEFIYLSLQNETNLVDSIFISLLSALSPVGNESINVSCGELFAPSTNLSEKPEVLLLTYNEENTLVTFHDSLVINGHTFFSVYEPINLTHIPKYDIKITPTQGIVYMQDVANDIELTYLRKE